MCSNAQLTGLHPRSEVLIDLTRAYDRGRIGWAQVEAQLERETSQVVELQRKPGFDYVSDGSLAWQDPLRAVTRSLAGVEAGTRYSRWFDTNTFYQKPAITGEISVDGFREEDFLRKDSLPELLKWKVSIPGPYTFSELSENKHYRNKPDLLLDLARAEREIARRLFDAGVSLVQISEPCLVYQPYRESPSDESELDLAFDGIRYVTEGRPDRFLVHTFFGDASPVIESLLALPVGAVGIDLYETELSGLHAQTSKDIVLGIVDSRESNVEDSHWIAETALRSKNHIKTPKVILAPNSDLKFLPRQIADRKVSTLAKAASLLEAS